MNLFKSDRCKACKTNRGYRFCARIGGGICWHDCNTLRVDGTCPSSCKYTLQESKGFQLKTNADSQTEYRDLLMRQMDRWLHTPQPMLNEKVPALMAETDDGRAELKQLLDRFPRSEVVPVKYLYSKCNIDASNVMDEVENPENRAVQYVQHLITQEWDAAVSETAIASHLKDAVYRARYLERLKSNKTIVRFKSADLISSAMTEKKDRILVHFEMNGRYDLTIGLSKLPEGWRVVGKILGKPELFNGENEAIRQVALLLSKNDLGNVFPLLKKYSEIYVDSADFQYYWGLYYTFSRQDKKARDFMLTAATLDPGFVEAVYNYAYLLHAAGELTEAEQRYREILEKAPEEPKTLNNLASICMEDGRLDEAEKLYTRCLKVQPDFEAAQQNLEKLTTLK